jgi:hypothetical protein
MVRTSTGETPGFRAWSEGLSGVRRSESRVVWHVPVLWMPLQRRTRGFVNLGPHSRPRVPEHSAGNGDRRLSGTTGEPGRAIPAPPQPLSAVSETASFGTCPWWIEAKVGVNTEPDERGRCSPERDRDRARPMTGSATTSPLWTYDCGAARPWWAGSVDRSRPPPSGC